MTAATPSRPSSGEPLAAALVRELLATPAVKALLAAGRPSHAVEAAPGVVRALLWQDVNASLSLAKDLPGLANALFAALETLATELGRFPEPVLRSFTAELLGAVDLAAARRAARAWLRLALRLQGPATTHTAPSGASSSEDPSPARAVGALVLAPALGAFSEWLRAHPDGLGRLARELLDPLPPDELRLLAERAGDQLAAVLRDHPALSAALARLVASLAWETVQGSLRAVARGLRRGGGSE